MTSIQLSIHFPLLIRFGSWGEQAIVNQWFTYLTDKQRQQGIKLFSFMLICISNNHSLYLSVFKCVCVLTVHPSVCLSVCQGRRRNEEEPQYSVWQKLSTLLLGHEATGTVTKQLLRQALHWMSRWTDWLILAHCFTGNAGNRESDDSTDHRPDCTESPSPSNHQPGNNSTGSVGASSQSQHNQRRSCGRS